MKYGTLVRINDPSEAKAKFHDLRGYGLDACQLVYKPAEYDLADAQIIRKAAEEEGIDISAQFAGYYDGDTVWDNRYGFLTAGLNVEAYRVSRTNYVKEAVKFAKAVGTTDVVIHAGFIPNNPFAPEYALMLTSIESISKLAEKLEMNILFETGADSPVALLRLITDIGRNNLYINLDPANLIMYGYGNPVDALYTFGKYVRNIHGKDGLPPTDPIKLGKEVPAGEGFVDFPKMFKALKDLNYDRYIIIEREITGPQQSVDILKALDYFKKLYSEIY